MIWSMRFACWIPKATITHSEYVILIAFPLQQWLRERALTIRLFVHCMFCNFACCMKQPPEILSALYADELLIEFVTSVCLP
jgi:hypothetical protein